MINGEDYLFLKKILRKKSGLSLTDSKDYLLVGRLTPVVRQLGFGSISELVENLRAGASEFVVSAVVDAMTTNETLFFRDSYPFEALVDVMLPAIIGARSPSQPIRIWCAAASTGQEPYSIAMQLRERSEVLKGHSVEILGTDLSADVLRRAEAGKYSEFEIRRGLSAYFRDRYFVRQNCDWILKPEIRQSVTFKQLNLLDSFVNIGLFDIIFCRNVLIYFDSSTKIDVLRRISHQMRSDGYLVLGGSETLIGLTNIFRSATIGRSLFQLNRKFEGASQGLGKQEGAAQNGSNNLEI